MRALPYAVFFLSLLTSCVSGSISDIDAPDMHGRLNVIVRSGAGSDVSLEQGDGIEDIYLWTYPCDADGNVLSDDPVAFAEGYFNDEDGWLTSYGSASLSLEFEAQSRYYLLAAVVNAAQFGYIYTGGEDEDMTYTDVYLDESTPFSELSAANFDGYSGIDGGFSMDAMVWEPIDEDAGEPSAMPASHWKVVDLVSEGLLTDGGVLNGRSIGMDVFRTVGKVRLYMGKASDDLQVVVDDVSVCSSFAPYEGALLSALEASVLRSGSAAPDAPWWFEGMSIYSDWFCGCLVNSASVGGGDVDIEIDGSESLGAIAGKYTDGGDVLSADGPEVTDAVGGVSSGYDDGGDMLTEGGEDWDGSGDGDSGDDDIVIDGPEGDSEDAVVYGEFIPVAVGPYYSPSAISGADGTLYEYIGARFLFENPEGWSDTSYFETDGFDLCPENLDPDCGGYYISITYRYTTRTDISLTDEDGYPYPIDEYIEDVIPGYYDLLDAGEIVEVTKYIPLPPVLRNNDHLISIIVR